MERRDVFIGFGSNLGDSVKIIDLASAMLGERIGRLVQMSSKYESEPWGFEADTNFINSVGHFKSNLPADEIMSTLLSVENEMGRKRTDSKNYESRPLDLDIIAIGEEILKTETVEIPHPRMHLRAFVLVPFSELSPDWIHPVVNQSVSTLIKQNSEVSNLKQISL